MEDGLKLWEVIKLCTEGAYIKGDMFKNEHGQILTYYGENMIFWKGEQYLDSEFNYYGNQYEVRK